MADMDKEQREQSAQVKRMSSPFLVRSKFIERKTRFRWTLEMIGDLNFNSIFTTGG